MSSKFAVLWVFQQVRTNGIPLPEGQRPTLSFKGKKHMICVAGVSPVRVIKRPVGDFDKLRVVTITGETGKTPYPVAEAISQLNRLSEKNGITQGAKQFLDRAVEDSGEDLDEAQFNNEEEITVEEDPILGVARIVTPVTTPISNPKPRRSVRANPPGHTNPPGRTNPPGEPRGPSKIGQAIEYMLAEIAATPGEVKQLAWRKALFTRTAEKFGISVMTCSIQFSKKIRKGLSI